ncbi:protein big brother-like isoform X2 [Diprion similis]|uniref:protein big brother-like isoform X2 n=1 Tax=Diprion similis TaxID=362088 RepID=UPI001EF80FC8|nr:protein big brother-like isoform X2 [Diprion similis]
MTFKELAIQNTYRDLILRGNKKNGPPSNSGNTRLAEDRSLKVRYTSYHDRPREEQQVRFQTGCREGHTEIAFAATGTNLQLVFASAASGFCGEPRECDFDKEHGKVHIRSQLIMNGVCVRWRGWIDLERLDGLGCLELDEELAAEEDRILREQIDSYNQRLRELDEKRIYRGGISQASHLNHHHHHGHHGHHVPGAGAPSVGPHLAHRQDSEMELRMGMQHQHQQQQQQQAAAARCHTGPSQRHPGLQPNLQARKLKNDLSHGHHN